MSSVFATSTRGQMRRDSERAAIEACSEARDQEVAHPGARHAEMYEQKVDAGSEEIGHGRAPVVPSRHPADTDSTAFHMGGVGGCG